MPPLALTLKQVARMLGISEVALRSRLSRGKGAPPFRRIGDRRIVCLQSELFSWLDGLECIGRARLKGVPDPEVIFDLGETERGEAER